ncbi:hypothetical protein PILCRDRAFT_75087 [Piloderma croceum F 1598]|uniref:rRNA adenine N(6)-methyltransferase n=1 Tax=Piloderma croceum (strain F 1598) TaxID=765440 RepID=A0A0C3BNN8_PILCF|nr:hypothetical protein PILCRDRAFT_75087 [Piloderma croceum F 1598]
MLRSTASLFSRATLRAPFSTSLLRPYRPRKNIFGPSLPPGRRIDPIIVAPDPEERIVLPDPSSWRTFFSTIPVKDRISVSNPKTAAKMADAFVPAGSRDKVIIEAFPGPGALTRALLALPKSRIRKLIVIDDHKPYLEYLQPLADVDPRLVVIPKSGFAWDSYQFMEDSGELSGVIQHPFSHDLHPHLQFISHLPLSTMGEQFAAQIFRCIPEREWLFKFGRVPLNLILSEHLWTRLQNPLNSSTRCKLTVIADATSDISPAIPLRELLPYDEHFHPTVSKFAPMSSPESRRIGMSFVAVDIKPLKDQAIEKGMIEKWDYCLRRLFVVRSKPLKSAISHLAPGAAVLIKKLANPDLPVSQQVDIKKSVRALEIRDWALLLKAFDEWPFAPQVSSSLINFFIIFGFDFVTWSLTYWIEYRNLWFPSRSSRTIGG